MLATTVLLRCRWLPLALCLALAGCGGSAEPDVTVKARSGQVAPADPQAHFVMGYDAGLAEARRRRQPMLIFFTAEWCDYCHEMLDEAFRDPAVVQLADQFVCVQVDADREALVCSEFRIRAYPTVQFLSPRGVPLNRITGKRTGETLYVEMQAALQAVARRTATERF